MRRTILSFAVLLASVPALLAAQTREITGRVTQAGTGTPITEATIGIVGAQVGVRANERGEYRLRAPNGPVDLLVRAIGYKRFTVRVAAAASTQDVQLDRDVLELEGVTVTGAATTVDKRNATTATATVSAEELTVAPAKSLEGNFAGKVVGATVFENSGVPGGGMQVQIRGATSILGQGDPLYVIDGVIVSNGSFAGGLASISRSTGSTSGTQDQTVNRLADINPADIENIEVLKSAAATAIYGSRATNGVVVITTKKGRSGQTHYNATQRVGTQQATRLLGSRHFASYADGCGPTRSSADLATCANGSVKPWLGASVQADSVAKANCTPTCAWYDWQGDLYNRHDPSFETLLSASGGLSNTRFFSSVNDRQTRGTQQNSGARNTTGRLNIDQSIGSRTTASGGLNVSHNFTQDGIGNNDNAGISPMYALGYSPAIYDLEQNDAITGRPVKMFMNGGGTATVNPFDLVHAIQNNEDTWRQIGSLNLSYAALNTVHNSVNLSFIGGMDRFQFEGNQYSPNFMQYEPADGFLGTAQVLTTTSRFINQGLNAVWTYSPGIKWIGSAQTSAGGTYETQRRRTYLVRYRGLVPTRQAAQGGTDQSTFDQIEEFRDQSMYANEQFIALDEKLALTAGFRADRGSANGDRSKYYLFPKFSGSYRFTEPFARFTNKIDEIKLRVSHGQSGNRPNYGQRELTVAQGGVIGGLNSLVAPTTVGNPIVKPEVMNETEYGVDAAFWNGRVSLETSRYERIIKDLLVNYPLALTSGQTQQQINGGQMSTRGLEAGVSVVPISTRNAEWTLRTTFQRNVQYIDKLSVPAFAPGGSFGVSYGRNFIKPGFRPTLIWGNQRYSCVNTTSAAGQLVVGNGSDGLPCRKLAVGEALAGAVTRDSVIADAAPWAQTTFLNTIRYKALTLTGLIDWRVGGRTSDMTKNLWDEGGNSRDYDDVAPDGKTPLGKYRYASFQAGDISPYIDNGTFVKFREVNLSFQAPKRWAQLARAADLRMSVQGRNLGMISKYWSFDPEFNNFGNANFNRFIDLAPYPSMRQFFFSIDLGY